MNGWQWKLAMVLTVFALPVSTFLLGLKVADTGQLTDRNRDALAYICATTTVLDDLVVQAGDQIATSLGNGTYERLRRQGIVTKKNITSARGTLAKYQAAHRLLRANGACADI